MKKKVLVWLSWWVDSAVAAYLLREQWYEVIPWFMKNYAEPDNPHCHTRQDRDSARAVCAHLWLGELQIFDFREEYRVRIIDYIYAEYQQWRTPNPDVLCNSLVKFDLFAEEGKKLWCDFVATGHYVRVVRVTSDKLLVTSKLLRWVDKNKDQSYFLSQLSQEQLAMSLFPLGELTKEEVRAIAKRIWLSNADRPDSQWLCFIGDVPIKEFLADRFPKQIDDVLDVDGNKIGTHEWAYFYTRGQRHGFHTPMRAYVVDTDVVANTITVVTDREDERLLTKRFGVSERHWIGEDKLLPYSTSVKIRYRQSEPVHATIELWDHEMLYCALDEGQRGMASGQFVVAYDGDEVIGSGVIELTPLHSS